VQGVGERAGVFLRAQVGVEEAQQVAVGGADGAGGGEAAHVGGWHGYGAVAAVAGGVRVRAGGGQRRLPQVQRVQHPVGE
jgi:hypothetical protein